MEAGGTSKVSGLEVRVGEAGDLVGDVGIVSLETTSEEVRDKLLDLPEEGVDVAPPEDLMCEGRDVPT